MRTWLAMALLCASSAAFAAQDEPSLVDLAQVGERARALALIDKGADVNAVAEDGSTALLWAVHNDDQTLIARLLKAHANVKAANKFGAAPMLEAAAYGDAAVIGQLLKAGADPQSANMDGETALMLVAHTSNTQAADLLLKAGAQVDATEKLRGQTALQFAAAESQPAMIKELLQHHAKPDLRSVVNRDQRQVNSEPRVQWRSRGGFTALLYAARQGCLACVQILVNGGADPNLSDPDGISPLLIATENFHFDTAVFLLKAGADANHWDWWGRTPLYAAVDLNSLPYGGRSDRPTPDDTTSLKMIEILLKAGANPNAQLKLFPPYRHIFVDRGADPMLTIGTTPLIRAAKAGDTDAIKLLLGHKALPDLPNSLGITPLMAAAGLGTNVEVDTRGKYVTQKDAIASIELLLAAGANINAVNNRGQPALHGAAFRGWNDVVKNLVGHHADLNVKDARGLTAVDMAMGRPGSDGRGRYGRGSTVVNEDTAKLLQQLMADDAKTKTAAVPPVRAASEML